MLVALVSKRDSHVGLTEISERKTYHLVLDKVKYRVKHRVRSLILAQY